MVKRSKLKKVKKTSKLSKKYVLMKKIYKKSKKNKKIKKIKKIKNKKKQKGGSNALSNNDNEIIANFDRFLEFLLLGKTIQIIPSPTQIPQNEIKLCNLNVIVNDFDKSYLKEIAKKCIENNDNYSKLIDIYKKLNNGIPLLKKINSITTDTIIINNNVKEEIKSYLNIINNNTKDLLRNILNLFNKEEILCEYIMFKTNIDKYDYIDNSIKLLKLLKSNPINNVNIIDFISDYYLFDTNTNTNTQLIRFQLIRFQLLLIIIRDIINSNIEFCFYNYNNNYDNSLSVNDRQKKNLIIVKTAMELERKHSFFIQNKIKTFNINLDKSDFDNSKFNNQKTIFIDSYNNNLNIQTFITKTFEHILDLEKEDTEKIINSTDYKTNINNLKETVEKNNECQIYMLNKDNSFKTKSEKYKFLKLLEYIFDIYPTKTISTILSDIRLEYKKDTDDFYTPDVYNIVKNYVKIMFNDTLYEANQLLKDMNIPIINKYDEYT